ncbi:MAG: hypothetical protein RSB34_07865 [Muribaculaceae bacterium]
MNKVKSLILVIFSPLLLIGQENGASFRPLFPKAIIQPYNQYQNELYKFNKIVPNFNIKNDFSVTSIPNYQNQPNYSISKPFIFERNPFARDWSNSGIISSWDTGALFGIGSYTTYPTIGSIGSFGIGFTQSFERLTISGTLTGQKYNLVNGIYNNFGFSGIASYKINDTFTLNVFGSVQSNNGFYSGAAMSVLPYSSYGGSLSVKFSEKFGTDFGVQQCYDPYSGRWRTLPIIAPYINIRGAKFGIDIGPIVLDMIQNMINNGSGNYQGNPTIRPTPPPIIVR